MGIESCVSIAINSCAIGTGFILMLIAVWLFRKDFMMRKEIEAEESLGEE
jgi:high-affinity Fe2+/Pb2+ permease